MSHSIRDLALSDLDREVRVTRTVLERIPTDRLEWRPHPKSFSLAQLGGHIAGLLQWQVWALQSPFFNMGTSPPQPPPPDSTEAVLERFDRTVEAFRSTLAATDDEALEASWEFRDGDKVLMKMPRWKMLRVVGINHLVHHRAQLTVYLRLLDVPVPPVYGPSADEQGGF